MKNKRQIRLANTKRIITKRLKLWRSLNKTELEAGRLRKKHPLDCGRANCSVCRDSSKGHAKNLKRKEPLQE